MDNPNPVTPQTKFLSIDVESNGLHGEGFAVGAVLIQGDGKILDEFSGRCPISGDLDPWVQENVLPVLENFPENFPDARALRDAFWEWYKQAKAQADYVLADNGYPVESRFLIACQNDDLENRYWDHPFPLLDLSSIFLQLGLKPLSGRSLFIAEQLEGQENMRHNPRWDAWVSALALLKALKMSGQL